MKNNINMIQSPNDQGERQPPDQQNRADDPKLNKNQNLAAVRSTALLGDNRPDSIAYLKEGTKLTLLVGSESEAKDLYNSMGIQHRKVLRCAWGQAEPRRVDGVYPHTDWQQTVPQFSQSVEEDGIPVFRQL